MAMLSIGFCPHPQRHAMTSSRPVSGICEFVTEAATISAGWRCSRITMPRIKQKTLTPAEVEKALQTGTRLNANDLVMWHDSKGGHCTTVGVYVGMQHAAETKREIEQEMRRIKQRKKEWANRIRQARKKR
jgi:hypothetical protein